MARVLCDGYGSQVVLFIFGKAPRRGAFCFGGIFVSMILLTGTYTMDIKTIDTYNNRATEYDEETVDFWETFPRTFIDTFANLAGKKVLNVGSGPARDSLLLKEGDLEVVCLDASPVMIQLSRDKGFESVLADFNSMPFSDRSFDSVWAYTSLLHIPKT